MIHRRHFLTGSVSLLGATAFRCRSAVGPVDVAAAPLPAPRTIHPTETRIQQPRNRQYGVA